jgi:hypothetical protein
VAHPETSLPERVRAAAAWVSGRARSVRIEEGAIEAYAASLPVEAGSPPDDRETEVGGDRELRAAFVVCLDAINFGSGWWPTIRKREGRSGYFTIAVALAERFRAEGAWPAGRLAELSAAEIATTLGQDRDHPLMADYAAALRDVGGHIAADHGGRFEELIEAARGSAVALAGLLAEWEAFADVSTYEGRAVPFFKRAQIAAADLDRTGVAEFPDLDRLTAFADNLVPHVLRVDGVLVLDSALAARIDAGKLLPHGSPEEVELRASAVQAVELLTIATADFAFSRDIREKRQTQRSLSPAEIDAALWRRGGGERYKSVPRPRSRNTAY